jgi:hypothetical protein
MLEGDKERFNLNDRVSIVIDADSRRATLLDALNKVFRQLPLKRVMETSWDPNQLLGNTAFKSTGKFRTLLGYQCRDYRGVRADGPTVVATTACFSASVAGAADFSRLLKLTAQHSRHPEWANSVPAGLPLLIETTRRANPAFPLPGFSAVNAAKLRNKMAKFPPQVERVVLTRISSQKLSPEVFDWPSGYSRRGEAPD